MRHIQNLIGIHHLLVNIRNHQLGTADSRQGFKAIAWLLDHLSKVPLNKHGMDKGEPGWVIVELGKSWYDYEIESSMYEPRSESDVLDHPLKDVLLLVCRKAAKGEVEHEFRVADALHNLPMYLTGLWRINPNYIGGEIGRIERVVPNGNRKVGAALRSAEKYLTNLTDMQNASNQAIQADAFGAADF